ncbi:MAG: hypothetical protein KDI03_04180 [Anaerolineae bacterium]|nr:hypothetical protein [Anaerolineae bacterium]MCB0205372.1 hypothetical protein [Anaerolineae bacterium]MCB0252471.1 hypothetical protein [Anaerolineae bacterium]
MSPSPALTAIQAYNDLCTPQMAADTWGMLEEGMRSGHLTFGERLLCTVLRPQFVSVQGWEHAAQVSATLVRAFDKAYLAMLGNRALRSQIWLTPDEETLISYEAGLRLPVPIGRLDCSLVLSTSGEGRTLPNLHLLEYNAESPAAVAYEDGLAELFWQTPLMRAFRWRYPVRPLWSKPAALQTTLRIYREWGGRDLPTIAIVDWPNVPTYSEFILFQEYFARHGITSVIVDPHDMDYRDGVLYASGTPVDFVYKRVLTHELLEEFGVEHPVIYAVRDRAVCMMNRFSCKFLHKKASLAVLSDERNAHLFTRQELETINTHIPWTRRVEERTTLLDGETVDLVPFIHANKHRLVLKPNDAYGGRGVVLGWDASEEEWQRAVDVALIEPHIVQLAVALGREDFPVIQDDGSVEIESRLVDFDPFMFDGSYAGGCLTRLSRGGLLNVTAGGGTTVPTMVVAV